MSKKGTFFVRFPLARRIEHVIMLVSFSLLGLTGLIQKYATGEFSQSIISAFGGIYNVRTTHHAAAIVLMFGTIYHIILAAYKLYVNHESPSMLPLLQDAKDGLQAFMYNIGIAKSRPQMGRFTFEEKMEYWAFVWGTIVMGLTGFMMWNPILVTRYLPGTVIPAAKLAHGLEAVLAVAAIIIWHFYGVHLKFFNKAMWTGKMSEEEMLHEHPLELADIKSGLATRPLDPAARKKRQRIFWPLATVATLVMLAGVFFFINSEVTAVAPEKIYEEVYVPSTPTPTPAKPESFTWEGQISPLLQQKCAECHGSSKAGGLSVLTYNDLMAGGNSGPTIVVGNSAGSLLIQNQLAGGHPGQLTPDEITYVSTWIDAGAPEK